MIGAAAAECEGMRDADVRTAVRQMLDVRHAGDARTRIVEEMGIWSGSVRIDVAVINGELHGYELKSARDTLERLPAQAALYSRVFDRVTLVAAERHVETAASQIPHWWGVVVAAPAHAGDVALNESRPAGRNPHVDAWQLARLLWRSEALTILERCGIDRGVRSGTVDKMAERLTERLSLEELAAEVRAALKSRVGWLGQPVGNQR